MKLIEHYIVSKQNTFQHHPFFQELEQTTDFLSFLKLFMPELAFYVMAAQDMMRLNEQRVVEPEMRKLAKQHRIEDAGHDRWFLQDMNYVLGVEKYDLSWLFSRKYTKTRDASYALLSEVFTMNDDLLRIVFLLGLESTGHIFFDRIAEHVEKIGYTHHLKYFSGSHLEVEKNHCLFEQEIQAQYSSINLEPDKIQEAIALIDRMYVAFNMMFDGLVEHYKAVKRVEEKSDEKETVAA